MAIWDKNNKVIEPKKTRKLPLIFLAVIVVFLIARGVFATANDLSDKFHEKVIAPLLYSQKLSQ